MNATNALGDTVEQKAEGGSSQTSPVIWLVVGMMLYLMTSKRWGTDALTWIAPIPYLYYLRHTSGLLSRLVFALALIVATTLGVIKISAGDIGIPGVRFVLQMGSLAAIPTVLVYLAWDFARRWTNEIVGLYSFPALYVLLEWYSANVASTGSWGGLANTQADNLALLQIGSVFGITAVTFLIAWVAALLELLLSTRSLKRWRVHIAVLAVAFLAVHVFGSIRLYGSQSGDRVRVAAVIAPQGGYPVRPGTRERVPGVDLDHNIAKTREAAARGAQLVAWTEASVRVQAEQETAIVSLLSEEARRLHIVLVATFGVAQQPPGDMLDNKFVLIQPNGRVALEYSKHEPVPGERSLRNDDPITSVMTLFGRVSGAICYDYDFPWIGRALARAGTGLAVAPSSDWRGIDPLHTKMARFRAIEGGYSLLRPTNQGASAAFDAYGRIHAWLPFTEANDRIMFATLPAAKVATVYSIIGDSFSYLCFLWLGVVSVMIGRDFLLKRGHQG